MELYSGAVAMAPYLVTHQVPISLTGRKQH